MKPHKSYRIFYKISLIVTIISGAAIAIGLFTNLDAASWFVFPFAVCLVATILLKLYIFAQKKNEHVTKQSNEEIRDKVKVIINGQIHYYSRFSMIQNGQNSDESSMVLTCEQDKKYYHLCFSCYEKQNYKSNFNEWVAVLLHDAKSRGLTLCPFCKFEILPDEVRLAHITEDKVYILARLTANSNEETQYNLSCINIADSVFIEYDFDKNYYAVYDRLYNKLGIIQNSTLRKLHMSQFEIECLSCYVYNLKINNNDKYVCDIIIILNDDKSLDGQINKVEAFSNKNLNKHDSKNKINNRESSEVLWETSKKCASANDILKIEYKGEAVPQNASAVILKNNHKFSAADFLSVYGYHTKKTTKWEYFYFLDKTRMRSTESGDKIYPTIKLTSKTIAHFPDLSSAGAQKYIALSYAERASKNYVVPACEIDDITHYRMGKYLFAQQQRLLKSDYCVIDIETTGLDRQSDQIIEMAALRVRNNEITETFTSFVKPTISIPSSATYINKITNEMVMDAPPLKDVITQFVEFVGNDTVIGHNISGFDLEFIIRDCKNKLGISFTNEYLDTLLLAKNIFHDMPNYKLSTLCRELKIGLPKHRAKSDCICVKKLFDKIKSI